MASDQLDDYLDRARIESAGTAVPDGFTDRVMRAVRVEPAPRFAMDLSSTVASAALILAGTLLLWESPDEAVLATLLVAGGVLWSWVDDPFGSEMRVRLSPW